MTEFEKWWQWTKLPKAMYTNAMLIQDGYEYLGIEDAEEIFDDIRNFLLGESK